MGHIRLGRLPKTRPWSAVFAALKSDTIRPDELARSVAEAARSEFLALTQDRTINYCFWILVRIVTAARGHNFTQELRKLGIAATHTDSGLAFVQDVSKTIDAEAKRRAHPNHFSEMAQLSLREALSAGIIEQSQSLFGTSLTEIQAACRAMSTQKRFGEVARDYFAHFTNRSIRFLAEKELANFVGPDHALKSPADALNFEHNLARYCSETAKIVEEFAAGWFSKHNWESNNEISEKEAAGFTSYALEKIQMELREARR